LASVASILPPRSKALPIRPTARLISQRPTIQATMAVSSLMPKSTPCVVMKFQMSCVFMSASLGR